MFSTKIISPKENKTAEKEWVIVGQKEYMKQSQRKICPSSNVWVGYSLHTRASAYHSQCLIDLSLQAIWTHDLTSRDDSAKVTPQKGNLFPVVCYERLSSVVVIIHLAELPFRRTCYYVLEIFRLRSESWSSHGRGSESRRMRRDAVCDVTPFRLVNQLSKFRTMILPLFSRPNNPRKN